MILLHGHVSLYEPCPPPPYLPHCIPIVIMPALAAMACLDFLQFPSRGLSSPPTASAFKWVTGPSPTSWRKAIAWKPSNHWAWGP